MSGLQGFLTRKISIMDKSKKEEFQKEHIRLHKEWSAAVGTPGYDKQEFRNKEKELHDKFRENTIKNG